MKKSIILPILLFVLSSQLNIYAQTKTVVDVPMKLRGLSPTVEVMVNGQGPFLFAIDTGAQGMARIDSSLVEKLGLKVNGQALGGDGSGSSRTLDTVGVDSIKLGDVEFKDITAITRNYNAAPNPGKIDGILGFNLFSEYLLTLDFPAKRVRLEKGELPAANGQNIISFENPRGIAVIEMEVGNQKVKADLDSGNMAGGFMLPTAVVEKSNPLGEPVVIGRARTVTSDIEIKQVSLKDTIRLGNFEFKEPKVTFPSLSEGNVGALIMQNFTLTFDQKNKRVKLEKGNLPLEDIAVKPLNPATINVRDYIGQYGDRTIFEENGHLFIQRPNGAKLKMVALSKDEFTLEQISTARIKFLRDKDGKVSDIQVLTPAGTTETVKKNPA